MRTQSCSRLNRDFRTKARTTIHGHEQCKQFQPLNNLGFTGLGKIIVNVSLQYSYHQPQCFIV